MVEVVAEKPKHYRMEVTKNLASRSLFQVSRVGGGVTLSKESPGSGPAARARLTGEPAPNEIESTVVIAQALPVLFSYEGPEGTLPPCSYPEQKRGDD